MLIGWSKKSVTLLHVYFKRMAGHKALNCIRHENVYYDILGTDENEIELSKIVIM